uniref:Uncharacterized protein n=1 Tax=Anguilla anguilla TaxID=7936 RepID=A0A0E9SMH3_ANGAN
MQCSMPKCVRVTCLYKVARSNNNCLGAR